MKPVLITAEKFAQLQEELTHRRSVVRAQVGAAVAEARSLGDLSENAGYHIARDEQGKNESRIIEIEEMLKHVQIVEKTDSDSVILSSRVTLEKPDHTQVTYTIVSPDEADIRVYKLSCESPIGVLLMGRKQGDIISHTTPSGVVIYKIVAVE